MYDHCCNHVVLHVTAVNPYCVPVSLSGNVVGRINEVSIYVEDLFGTSLYHQTVFWAPASSVNGLLCGLLSLSSISPVT